MDKPPIVIAEIGINHGGKMSLARELILRAKEAGCAVAKFQAYSVDKLFPDGKIMARGRNWIREVRRTELGKEQLAQIAEWCKEAQIEFLCSAFDCERLQWLEEMKVRRHKVATRCNNDLGYIAAVKATGKPYFISFDEESFNAAALCARAMPLYCVPEYPAPLGAFKLGAITFDPDVAYDGISDHSQGITVAITALGRGATVVEKHFTLDKDSNGGPDHICSATPREMKRIVDFANVVWQCL